MENLRILLLVIACIISAMIVGFATKRDICAELKHYHPEISLISCGGK